MVTREIRLGPRELKLILTLEEGTVKALEPYVDTGLGSAKNRYHSLTT